MKKTGFKIVLGLVVVATLLLAYHNYKNNAEFLVSSATTCISILTAAILSFYFVQRQTDIRKQKEIFIELLESLKSTVDDSRSYNFSEVSREQILMRKRDLNNKISFVKEYSKKFSIDKDMTSLESLFKEYETIIGDHIDDLDTLRKLENELHRPLTLISQNIFKIMLNLYN